MALEATKFSLGVAGIKPAADAQVNVNLELRAGYIINLAPENEAERQMIERQAKIVGGVEKVIESNAVLLDESGN